VQRAHLEEQLVEFIRLLAMRQTEQPPTEQGIGISEALLLLELSEVPSMTQRALAERLVADKSTVSRSLASLDRRGWVRRTPHAEDRRVLLLQLTPAGHDATARLRTLYRARHRHLIAGLTAAEREALGVGLAGLIRQMRAG
jgi:DNA-binding MarR family transcriptional regulator